MRSYRTHSAARARVTVVVVVLVLLVAQGHMALGAIQQPEPQPSSATERAWPEGVELLAAQELDLSAGEYQWRNSTLTAPPEDGELLEVRPGVVIASNGAILVEVNDVQTIRLNTGAALPLQDDDEIVVTSAGDAPVQYLVVELTSVTDAEPEDTETIVGPLTIPEGAFTMVLVNLPAEATDDTTVEQVIGDALRPGVLISHTDEGIPAGLVAGQEYDRWIVVLYPSGEPAATAEPSDAPGTPETTGVPTVVPPAVAPLPAQPTMPPPTATSVAPTAPPVPTAPAPLEPVGPTAPAVQPLAPTEAPQATEPSQTELQVPTMPPIPTVPPVPTLPPFPTMPPIPTVPPVPTLPPLG